MKPASRNVTSLRSQMMICCEGTPAAINPRATAATTAGRVPLFTPGFDETFSPMTSWVLTRLSHASRVSVFPVNRVMPRRTMV